jgi:hypothetical protein
MPQNLTQIANSALIKLGADTVASLASSDRIAALVRERLVPVVHRLLRDHAWHFATKITDLAPLGVPPHLGDWTYAFLIPPDCLRVRRLDTEKYEIVGQNILCDKTTLSLRYTQRMVDNTDSAVLFIDDFAEASSAFLAYEISPSVTGALPLREDLFALGNRLLAFARFNGAVEVPQYQLNQSSWLDSRLVWNGQDDDRRLYPLDAP